MQIDLKTTKEEIGMNMIIEVRFQIQLMKRNDKIRGLVVSNFRIELQIEGSEIYFWMDPA